MIATHKEMNIINKSNDDIAAESGFINSKRLLYDSTQIKKKFGRPKKHDINYNSENTNGSKNTMNKNLITTIKINAKLVDKRKMA